ncbi:DNA polymerase-3 subunit epsilon [Enemella evansiae]|nr:DNA polymerase-3 subunit epsilon [Enemella evansiae]
MARRARADERLSEVLLSVRGMSTAHRIAPPLQPSLTDLGTPLPETTFVVVDLETTGGSESDAITEIGAVKVRGGEVIGEFQTLVDPNTHIPALIQVLTGITNQLVAGAPRLAEVLPAFLEFGRGAVWVAHNAGFDIGFLKRACATHEQPWPAPRTLDTVALARQVLLRDEVPNHKLATLANHFHAATTPNHRALSDARATVDVLHGLIERIGNLGVHTLEDLLEFTRRVSPQRRAKRTWADDLPAKPGVYLFHDEVPGPDGPQRRVLYVGKSTNIRRRVRSYFTAAETRRRMDEMVRVAHGVQAVVCVTPLQAEVTELRLIEQHSPRYNRRSRFPRKLHWLKVTDEPYPRLSLVRQVRADDASYLGPFRNRQSAEQVLAALHDAFPIRQCTDRLTLRGMGSPCALAGMGRCLSPCDHSVGLEEYAAVVEQLRECLAGDVRPVLAAARSRMHRLIEQQRFEEAEVLRDRLTAWSSTALRHHRVASLSRCPELVAARHTDQGWEIHVIRHGRLAGAALARPGEVPQAVAREAVTLAETVVAPPPPLPAGTVEEAERIAAWLESPGVRLIEVTGDWSWPLHVGLGEGGLAAHTLGERR